MKKLFKKFNRRTIVTLTFTLVIFVMSLGYAALSQFIEIEGVALIDRTWNVKVTNVTSSVVGEGENVSSPYVGNTVTINAKIPTSTSKITYTITLKNEGNIRAKLHSIEKIEDKNKNITYTISGIEEGTTLLNPGEENTVTVIISVREGVTSLSNIEKSIMLSFNYVENENQGGITSTPIEMYDYMIGDKLNLIDGSTWYVVKNSSKSTQYVSIISEASYGSYAFDTSGSTMYNPSSTTNIGYIIENTILQNIKAAIDNNNGNSAGTTGRLLTLAEYNKFVKLGKSFGSDYTWLMTEEDDVKGNYYNVSEVITKTATETGVVRPVIVTLKSNIVSNQIVIATNATIENGKTMTNLITNGGYETDEGWSLEGADIISSGCYSGGGCLRFNPSVTAMTIQTVINPSGTTITAPTINHKYYGRLMFRSSSEFTVSDSRFEWYSNDNSQGALTFGQKNVKTNTWSLISSIQQVTANTYLSNQWNIRNFTVSASHAVYADEFVMLDLTDIYGSGNEPTQEWLDNNILYFDGTVSHISGLVAGTKTYKFTPKTGYEYHSMEGCNGTYDSTTNTLTITVSPQACKINFEIRPATISVVDTGNASLNIEILNGSLPVSTYCVNKLATDVSSCEWQTLTTQNFEVPITTNGTYYIHAKDIEGNVFTSDGVAMRVIDGSFDLSITSYTTLKVTNVNINASSYEVKYASGIQDDSYFKTSGTDITSSLSLSPSSGTIYTIALLNNGDVIATKKVYIYKFSSSTSESRSTTRTVSGITAIEGEAFTHTGTATASLSGTSLSLTAKNGSYYTYDDEFSCPNGGTYQYVSGKGYYCTASDYNLETIQYYDCPCGETASHTTCTASRCEGNCNAGCGTGYTRGSNTTISDFSSTSSTCTTGTWETSKTFTGDCLWNGDYKGTYVSTTYYYRYMVGVIVK